MIQGRFTTLVLGTLLGSVVMISPRTSAAVLWLPVLNAMIAQQVDDLAVAHHGENDLVDYVLAKDSPIVVGSPAARWLTFDLKLSEAHLPMIAASKLFAASVNIETASNDATDDESEKVSSSEITFDPSAIDNTWLHVSHAHSMHESSPIASRIRFSAVERSSRLFGPGYEGARNLTFPSVYSWQLAPRISLNQDFHFMHDPLGPERDFEDSWATGFRVQIKF
jgi:hypothetical protein